LTSGTAAAVEWDVHEVEAERQAEQLAHEMRRRTDPRRGVAVFAGVGFDEGNEVTDRVHRQRRVDREHRRCGYRQRDRVEILGGIVGHSLVERGIDDVVGAVDEERVAVGARLRGAARSDIAARAGDVLDVELNAHLLGQLLSHEAGEHIGRTAGREWNDHAHRSCGIGLRPTDPRNGRERGGTGGQAQKLAAGRCHVMPVRRFYQYPPSQHSHAKEKPG